MFLSTVCVTSVLACCIHLGESRRYSQSYPDSRRPLTSALVALARVSGHLKMQRRSEAASAHPQMQIPSGTAKVLASSNNELGQAPEQLRPEYQESLSDMFDIYTQLGLHDQIMGLMDQRRNSIQRYHDQLMAQIRREQDDDVNLMRYVYELKVKNFGKDHPETYTSQYNYADVLSLAGRHVEAEPLKQQLMAVMFRDLGAEHADTLKCISSYAETLLALDREAEIEPLQKYALETMRRSLGPEHPVALKALKVYAKMLTKLSRHAAAAPLWKEALDIEYRLHDALHLDCLKNYDNALKEVSRIDEAKKMIDRQRSKRRRSS